MKKLIAPIVATASIIAVALITTEPAQALDAGRALGRAYLGRA